MYTDFKVTLDAFSALCGPEVNLDTLVGTCHRAALMSPPLSSTTAAEHELRCLPRTAVGLESLCPGVGCVFAREKLVILKLALERRLQL